MRRNKIFGNRWMGLILQMQRIYFTPPPSAAPLVNIEGR
nr:MAG TPA: hypothetical protein [Caudoviricetes sp.]